MLWNERNKTLGLHPNPTGFEDKCLEKSSTCPSAKVFILEIWHVLKCRQGSGSV